ncbi:MAG: ABC transporter ATP-binding protein [Putridiphycobacter sp.]
MIDVKDVILFLGNENAPLHINNFQLENGLWALIGRNGSGKSTFLNALSGNNSQYKGTIFIGQKNISNYSQNGIAKQISIVLSKTNVFGNLTGKDILFLGRIPHQGIFGKKSKEDAKKVEEIIKLLELANLINKPFSVLSDGEKQLLMIGRALVQDTPIILLDEPTAFLDVFNRHRIVKILEDICITQQKLIIFSTHNLELAKDHCKGFLIIDNQNLSVTQSQMDLERFKTKLFENEI